MSSPAESIHSPIAPLRTVDEAFPSKVSSWRVCFLALHSPRAFHSSHSQLHSICLGGEPFTEREGGFLRCMLRVLDSFGTEPEFNHAHYAQSKGHKTPWGKWNLNPQQFNTMFRK
ncbi:hypothetical protein INR49_026099 [Caranx melampygus]|nr:hypothetical protein INR49_026099 [Caranx melampygus]